MVNFIYDFRYNTLLQLLKKYWYILIFAPIVLSIIIEALGGRLWLAMMVSLCRIDGFAKYFPAPFSLDYDDFAILLGILFLLFYLFCLIFRKIWLLIPSIFFLMFPVEYIYEHIIHEDYDYIGDKYIVFLDNDKIGVMDCWRNTIIAPTYKWYLPCYEYGEDGKYDNKTNITSLILCVFCEDEKYYAFTRHEQLVLLDRIVLNPKYKKQKVNFFNAKKDNTLVTLLEKKREQRKSLYWFKANFNDENILGYLMSVNRYNPVSFNNHNISEYHFISRIGGYLGSGNFYIIGCTDEQDVAIAFSNDKKRWDILAMQDFDIIHSVSSDDDLAHKTSEYIEGFNSNLEYYDGIICDGIYISNRVEPDDDRYILESKMP